MERNARCNTGRLVTKLIAFLEDDDISTKHLYSFVVSLLSASCQEDHLDLGAAAGFVSSSLAEAGALVRNPERRIGRWGCFECGDKRR